MGGGNHFSRHSCSCFLLRIQPGLLGPIAILANGLLVLDTVLRTKEQATISKPFGAEKNIHNNHGFLFFNSTQLLSLVPTQRNTLCGILIQVYPFVGWCLYI